MSTHAARIWIGEETIIKIGIALTTAIMILSVASCGPTATMTEPVSSAPPPATRLTAQATPTPDASTTTSGNVPEQARFSDQLVFQVWYESERQPPPVNELHSWVLHIVSAAGEPVEHASVTVDGDMPEHGHGLPTQPRVTEELGQGRYKI